MEQTSLAAAIRLIAARARAGLGPHPDAALLAAYAEGALDDQARDQLRDHLALCPDCVQSYLALRCFLDEAAAPPVLLSPEQLAADWAALRRRLVTAGLLPDHPPEPDTNGEAPGPASSRGVNHDD